MKKLILLAIALAALTAASAQQQEYYTGALEDDGTYETLPIKATLVTRDYSSVPPSHSMFNHCPEVKTQSSFGTCAAWATAYAARTIAEAVKYGWTDRQQITREAFSPLFIYAQVKNPGDDNCQLGSQIYKSVALMKEVGAAKFTRYSYLCASNVSQELKDHAALYRIDDYARLFNRVATDDEKVTRVKKSISQDHPVVIAMHIPGSFFKASGVWSGQDIDPTKHGYHAMCVIGYDDAIGGGSFHIMNSWGSTWGQNGFIWVKYSDFAKYVDQAFEIYVKKAPAPQPKPNPQPTPQPTPSPKPQPAPAKANRLSGSLKITLATGESLRPALISTGAIPHYRLNTPLISGTRYRAYISNDQPAYVYMIGSDLTNNVSRVFPPNDRVSPALTYSSNHVAIPDETYYIEMDQTKGKDYMCVIYSAKPLDILDVARRIRLALGSFYDKVNTALAADIAPTADVTYSSTAIGFKAATDANAVALIVEIPHN